MVAISGPELYLFSSDYPHPEGTKDPIGKFERSFDEHGIDEAARQLLLRGQLPHADGRVIALTPIPWG